MIENIPPASTEATMNIGAVTRMTGIPIATLRAWERRYGFPHISVRTEGGHRLYSEQDVTLLRSVKQEIERGLSAHQAVTVVLERFANYQSENQGGMADVGNAGEQNSLDTLRSELEQVLIAHDLHKADVLMGEMLSAASPEQIILDVIGPLLADLGEAWSQGRISVSDEHLASNYLRQRMLMWLMTATPPRQGAPILLACAPGEWHEGSLLMLAVLLRRRGWPVEYLGQNVPLQDLAALVKQMRPRAVVLAAMGLETARELAGWQKWVHQQGSDPLLTYGGRPFVLQPELKEKVPGIYLGDDIPSGVKKLEELLA